MTSCLDAKLDSPQVFANAARRSVARLNLDKVLEHLPGATPVGTDVNRHSAYAADNERKGGRRTILVDLVSFLKPLYKGSKKIAKSLPQWTAKCRGYLTSAINGGQWPQIMKAKLPTFVGTPLCQLCHMSDGTLAHRHCCAVTKPTDGWTPLGEQADDFIRTLSEQRAATLKTR